MTLTIGELCAGYNGLGMAVEEVFGARPAWFSEFEDAPSRVLAHHWPNVPNLGDMTRINWAAVEPVDIISGGTPCQDLSHAGKRAGMTEGTRSNLWVQMREAVATIRPRYVVWENVRGAYSAAADSSVEPCPGCVGDGSIVSLRALGRVLGDLSELGYDSAWHGLTAASVGAPHSRYRVFVLGWAATQPEGGRRASVNARAGSPAACSGRERLAGRSSRLTSVPDAASDGRHERRAESTGLVGRPDAAQRSDATADAAEIRRGRRPQLAKSRADGRPRGARPASDGPTDWGRYEHCVRAWERVLGRAAPSPTEPSRNGLPRLSPAFSEWMMGIPEGHVTNVPGISRNDRLNIIGNGVVPQQAAAALRHMLAATEAVRAA